MYPIETENNEEIVNNEDTRYSDREVIEIPFKTYEIMEKHFGTTKNFDVAGYLLIDGKMLDFMDVKNIFLSPMFDTL